MSSFSSFDIVLPSLGNLMVTKARSQYTVFYHYKTHTLCCFLSNRVRRNQSHGHAPCKYPVLILFLFLLLTVRPIHHVQHEKESSEDMESHRHQLLFSDHTSRRTTASALSCSYPHIVWVSIRRYHLIILFLQKQGLTL